jgi:hypothetical protein
MRNGQNNNKRMRGRNRNHKSHHSGGGGGGGGGGHHHNPLTRVYESNGPEVKIRGTAHHVAEKYLQLARDAQTSGDTVNAENHFQHAEHYLRLIAAAQEQFRQQNPYYQAPPAPGQIASEEGFDGDDDEGSQPTQGQGGNQGGSDQGASAQGGHDQGGSDQNRSGQSGFNQPAQPQQNANNAQNYGNAPNYNNNNNQQPSYQPREQPQPYGGQPHGGQQRNYQPRQPQQSYNNQPPQQPHQPPQQYQPPQPQPVASDVERLPSFITGSQPQPVAPQNGQSGQDGDQGGERFPRHRRRRHRTGGPRPEIAGSAPQEFGGGDGPEPGNT